MNQHLLHALEAGEDSGATPLVMLHGLFGQARNFGRLQRALATDRKVIALDLRSHGQSEPGPLVLREMAADVAHTLRARGIERATLLGHSLGGKVAMALGLDEPTLLDRLIVADIAPVPYRHDNIRLVHALQSLALRPDLTRTEADRALAATIEDASVRGLLLQSLVTGPRPGWRLALDEIAASLEQAEGWPDDWRGVRWDGPALFITGGASRFVTAKDWAAVQVFFPEARREVVKGAGHWLHAEQPEAFADLVRGFLPREGQGVVRSTLSRDALDPPGPAAPDPHDFRPHTGGR